MAALTARLIASAAATSCAVCPGDDRQPHAFGRQNGVERAAEGHVQCQRPVARHVDRQVARIEEGGHIQERDPLHAPILVEVGGGAHQPGGRVEVDGRLLAARRQRLSLEQRGDERDHAMAAHGAIALVVQEEHAKIGLGRDGRGQHTAIHVVVAARLPHQGAS